MQANLLRRKIFQFSIIVGATLFSITGWSGEDLHKKFGQVELEELASLLDADGVTVLDANSQWYRKEVGVIPGATLLSHYSSFDVAELPANKDAKLVFYCSNTQCTAAPIAAQKAKEAGFTDVNVLPVGIKGWVEAEYDVDKV